MEKNETNAFYPIRAADWCIKPYISNEWLLNDFQWVYTKHFSAHHLLILSFLQATAREATINETKTLPILPSKTKKKYSTKQLVTYYRPPSRYSYQHPPDLRRSPYIYTDTHKTYTQKYNDWKCMGIRKSLLAPVIYWALIKKPARKQPKKWVYWFFLLSFIGYIFVLYNDADTFSSSFAHISFHSAVVICNQKERPKKPHSHRIRSIAIISMMT